MHKVMSWNQSKAQKYRHSIGGAGQLCVKDLLKVSIDSWIRDATGLCCVLGSDISINYYRIVLSRTANISTDDNKILLLITVNISIDYNI